MGIYGGLMGSNGNLWWFNGGLMGILMGIYGGLMGSNGNLWEFMVV